MFSILLADHNDLFRHALCSMLARHFPFMLLLEAASVEKALALGTRHRPQLTFIDVKLPDGSGLEAVRRLKSANPAAAVGIVTQHDIEEYRIAAEQCGADHFIVKDDACVDAIVAVVESTVSSRFRVLLAHRDGHLRDRVANLLIRHWPAMLVVDGSSELPTIAATAWLRPDAVLFGPARYPLTRDEILHAIRDRHPDSDLVIITKAAPAELSLAPLPFPAASAFWVQHDDRFDQDLLAAISAIVATRKTRRQPPSSPRPV